MDNIFLTPEQTFGVTVRTTVTSSGVPVFTVEDGGPYKLRTCTGREYHRVQRAFVEQDANAAFKLLGQFLEPGIIPEDKLSHVHPDCVWALLLEVLKHSRIGDAEAGK